MLAVPEQSAGKRLYLEAVSGGSKVTILDSFISADDDRLVQKVWAAGRNMVQAGRHSARYRISAPREDRTSINTLTKAI